jgi:hypothetical protein
MWTGPEFEKRTCDLDGDPANRATGHPSLCPANRIFFYFTFNFNFNFNFRGKSFFFLKKNVSPGTVHGNCLSTGKFSPPTSFSPLQHQGVSPIQHPSLSFPTSLSFPSPLSPSWQRFFQNKKKISGEVNRDKTDRRSLVSSRRTLSLVVHSLWVFCGLMYSTNVRW